MSLDRAKKQGEAFSKLTEATATFFGLGSHLSGFGELAALSASGVMSEALLVLDDLERRAPGLELSGVLGCVMRLVEVRGSRVLVICNEDKLDKKDRESLDQAREKVFDLEHAFEPSVEDSVAALVDDELARKRLLRVLKPLNVNNLRLMAKAREVAYRFEEELFSVPEHVRERIVENAVHITALKWFLGGSIDPRDLPSRVRRIRHSRPRNDRLISACRETNFIASYGDKLIIEYLRSGKIDVTALQEAAQDEAGYRDLESEWQEDAVNELEQAYRESFAPISDRVLSNAKRVLTEPFTYFEWPFLLRVVAILQELGASVDRVGIERRWAKEWMRVSSRDWDEKLIEQLQDAEARAILIARRSAHESAMDQRGPGITFLTLFWMSPISMEREDTEEELLAFPELQEPEWFRDNIRSDFNIPVDGYDGVLAYLKAKPRLRGVFEALTQGLLKLSEDCPDTTVRVQRILSSLNQDSNTLTPENSSD